MMESKILKRIPLEDNIVTLQKCHLSTSYWEKINPENYLKPFAIIECSPECHYVCRLGLERDMDPGVIMFSDCVVKFRHTEGEGSKDIFPSENIFQKIDKLNISSIRILPVSNLKSLSVTVVFENVKSIKKWRDKVNDLQPIVKSMLQMYVVSELTVVSLKNLEASQRLGIHCFIIHRASLSATGCVLGKIVGSTKISINKLLSRIRFEQKQKSHYCIELGGLSKPYQALKDIIELQHLRGKGKGLQPCHQVLLIGPSGGGKTSLVHKIAADCGAVLVTLLGPEVVHPKPGGTEEELTKVFQKAFDLSEEGLTILLLDDVDTICLKRERGYSSHAIRATTQLLILMERANDFPNLVIVAATNRPYDLDPSVRRPGRLEREIYIGVPTEQQRKEILYILARPMLHSQFEHTAELCSEVARLTPGYVGADLSLLCHDVAFHRYKRKDTGRASDLREWLEDFRAALGRIRPSQLSSGLGVVTTHPVQLSDIGGLDGIKKTLRIAVEWPLTHPEAFARLGLPQPKGVLLYGPPGCAKTQLARALASATSTTFLATSAAELYSPFVGDAEKSVVELFHRARLGAPTILFIDEIDALVGKRSDKEKSVQERVLSAFLTEMDGVGVSLEGATMISNSDSSVIEGAAPSPGIIVIGATNRPDYLDDALLRPGRFDKLIYVPPPDIEGRVNILKIYLAKTPLAPTVDIQDIAERTEFFSGADIKNLCREAALHALTENGMDAAEVTHRDFLWSLDNIRPSLSRSQIQWYINYNIKK